MSRLANPQQTPGAGTPTSVIAIGKSSPLPTAPAAIAIPAAPVAIAQVPAVTVPSAVVSTDDAFVSRILYPDLSILSDNGANGAVSGAQNITMYAVAPPAAGPATVTAAAPAAQAPFTGATQFQIVQNVPTLNPIKTADYQHPADYYCHDCNITFGHANAFLEHISQGHPEQNTALQLVPSTTAATVIQPQNLSTQPMVEVGKMVLRCSYCTETFQRRQDLTDHIQAAHTTVTVQPHVMLASADGTAHLVPAGHTQPVLQPVQFQPQILDPVPAPLMGSGEGLFCPDCRNPFANKYSLMKHLRSTKCRHESEVEINKIINDQLTCGRCLKQFGSIQALKKHVEGNYSSSCNSNGYLNKTFLSSTAKKCQAASISEMSRVVPVAVEPVQLQAIQGQQMIPVQQTGEDQVVQSKPSTKGLVMDESISLQPDAMVQVYRCPIDGCNKPCVTLRAFKMHAKCVHKGTEMEPVLQEAKANFICKVSKVYYSRNYVPVPFVD